MTPITSLDDISGRYRAIFCDVWGVLHDGVTPFEASAEALWRARDSGRIIILVTNSPRPNFGVIQQLGEIGVGSACFDAIVTSGDVTRKLIAAAQPKILHIGPERDLMIYDGFEDTVQLVGEAEAETVVCTGLFADESETPADYAAMLARLKARDLPFICANPDVVVERGDRLIWCAGAIARDYAALGGRSFIAGKPHPAIYTAAHKTAEHILGSPLAKSEILAIGDGIATDIKGASDNGYASLFISGGIHAGHYTPGGVPDRDAMNAFVASHGFAPVAEMQRLA
jgi:HAD superfamily hydrolase (TIGR01450 family)